MKTLLRLLPAALLCLPLSMQGQATKLLTADKHNEYGLVYTLPTTALRVTFTATRTIEQAGPYAQYAKRYMGTDKAVTEDRESWTIDRVEIEPVGVPDPENRYVMQLKPGALTSVCVDPNGMLLAINKSVPAPAAPAAENRQLLKPRYTGKEYLQYVTEDFLASQSSAKQAQMLSESLMEVRDSKLALTRGTADNMPTDGRQLELMLASLDDQEGTMSRAFLGCTDAQTVTRSFLVTPEDAGKTILCRLSSFDGFVDADDLSGEPVYLTVSNVREAELPADDKGEEKKLPKDAVVYAIPGSATVSVSFRGKTLATLDAEMAQFGILFGLSPILFTDKKSPSSAEFDPATGALLKISAISSYPEP